MLKKNYKYVILIYLFAALAYLFPYTGDDWAWGCNEGLSRLQRHFDGYNGRWAGNLWVIILTRSNLMKTISMGICMTGTVYLIEKICGEKKSIYLAAVLLLLTPRRIFRQAIVWTSGFTNYNISTFFILLCIFYLLKKWESNYSLEGASVLPGGARLNKVNGPWLLFIPVLLAINNSLYLENLTIVNVFFAIVLAAYWGIRNKKIDIQMTCYAAGSLAGTALMFSNSAYHKIAEGGDATRAFGTKELIRHAAENYFGVTAIELGRDSWILFLVLFVLSIATVHLFLKEVQGESPGYDIAESDTGQRSSRRKRAALIASLGIMALYVLVSVLNIWTEFNKYEINGRTLLIGITLFAYMISLLYIVTVTANKSRERVRDIFTIIFAMSVLAPMMVVRPIGPRSFYCSYVLMVLLACSMAAGILERVEGKHTEFSSKCTKVAHMISVMLGVAALCLFASYGKIFYEVHSADEQRIHHIFQKVQEGASEVEVASLPHTDYVWNSNPLKYKWAKDRYRKFYGIPLDVELNFAEIQGE